MNFRKTILAASIAVVPLLMANAAIAAGPMMAAPAAQASPQENATLVAKLAATRGAHGLDQNHGFAVAAQHPGAAGEKITRAAHTYKGVRVWKSESVVVTDASGNIVSESSSDRRAGLGNGSANTLGAGTGDFDVKPAIAGTAAIDTVVRKVAPGASHHAPPSAELIIFPIISQVRVAGAEGKTEAELNAVDVVEKVTGYELAYVVKTRMTKGDKAIYHDSIVSAKSGKILKQWTSLQTVVGTGKSQYNGSVPINTTLSGTTYSMKDASRGTGGTYGGMAITNANHTTSAGSIYTNTTNTWGDGLQYVAGGSTTNANGQTAAVNAMWGLMNTYDTLKNVLGWSSLDGNNTATYIAAHVNTAYDNAYYSDTCKCMFIGDGGTGFNSLGSIDVIGHEMGHGVTDATSGLIYDGESGGLNESNSDITGEMVEAYARAGGTGTSIPATGNDWMMGKEIAKDGQPLRWLYKPSLDGSSPNAWSSSISGIDVHLSSGPNNRMFYFLSQGSNATSSSNYYSQYLTKQPLAMTGIGNDKAFRIWFKANTTLFTASTNYADARTKVLAAANSLYGAGSKESIAVQRAYAAINVGADVPETPIGGALTISSQPASKTVTAGSAASFSVTATGGTAPYKYQWTRGGVAIAGATSATYSLTAQASDNGAVFAVKVTDSATSPTTATSSNATLTVGTTPPPGGERIVNGGFEVGTAPWAGTTGVIGAYAGQSAADGTRFAWLGGNGATATETLTQSFSIPSTAASANLTFSLHIDTAETTTSTAYDKLVVTVKNSAGTTLGTLATYSNLNKAAGYQTRSFSLLAYKGQTVTLSFAMTEDSSQQTSFVVDKVSVLTN
ncbi:M4 family metallopeptidase [Massilia sp. TSP1-1-2]|uniref:M4 family metallopeptidase n=1 Tax=Massilia sp. TSP1-1-2 TaxID=2804649 RepID=UPI003CF434E2